MYFCHIKNIALINLQMVDSKVNTDWPTDDKIKDDILLILDQYQI